MHVFHFKMYISAVFSLITMNLTPYSPTVTWYMWAGFAAFTPFGTKGVNVWVFGPCTISKWSDRMGCSVKVVHHDKWCMYNKFHTHCNFLVKMAAC